MYHQKHFSVILSVSLFLLFSFTFSFFNFLPPVHAADNDILITEIMYNPEGSDSNYEWVEIYNSGTESVEIVGGSGTGSWRVVDGSSNRTFAEDAYQGDMTLTSNEYGILAKNPDQFITRYPDYTGDIIQVSGMSLGNSGDSVGLKIGDDTWSLVAYENSWGGEDGHSLSKVDVTGLNEQVNWVSSKEIHGSPGLPYEINLEPHAEFSVIPKDNFTRKPVLFTASQSYDEDGVIIDYFWDFGDEKQESSASAAIYHTYTEQGEYPVSLTVTDDGDKQDSIEQTVTIQKTIYSRDIIISEFLPAPSGETDWNGNGEADSNDEWIELYNSGDVSRTLNGWIIDDEEGGSTPFIIPDHTSIGVHQYLVFHRSVTGIILNNDSDKVRLFNPDGELMEEISYQDIEPNNVYAKDSNQKWQTSITPTPGAENVIESEKNDVIQEDEDKKVVEEDTKKDEDNKVQEDDNQKLQKSDDLKIPELTIRKARNQNIGAEVIIKGVVTATPEILGSRVIYIQDNTGGIKIKLLAKDYSTLTLGDEVKVSGKMSESYNERYLSMQADSTFQILSHKAVISPKSVKTGDVNEKLEGELVTVNARVVSTSGNTFYLDDGSGQVKVYIKDSSNIDKPKMRTGYYVQVVGIVSQYKDDYRILPRYQNDLIVSKSLIENGAVLGAVTELPDTGASGSSIALGVMVLGFIIRIGITKKFV